MAINTPIQTLDPRTLRELEAVLQWQRRTGARTTVGTPQKPQIDRPDPNSVPAYNAASADVPQYGVIELGSLRSDGVRHDIDAPAYSSISRYAIACNPISIGKPGRVWTKGMHPALIILKPGETLSIRDQVRPHKGSFYARLFELGPMIVESVIGDASNATAEDLLTVAMVTMSEERGDHKLADTQGVCDGPYQAFAFSNHFTVSAGAIGKPTVDSA